MAAIAAGWSLPNLWHIALFFIGAFAMRGAGCTWNDIVDRDLDRAVERTSSRPIPSGQVSVTQAALFLIAQSLVGLLVLLAFNAFTIALGIASLAIVAIYPFMKRITYWPQIVLGLAFSWGALMGWAGAFGRLDLPALLLYAGSISRTPRRCSSWPRGRGPTLLPGVPWNKNTGVPSGSPEISTDSLLPSEASTVPVNPLPPPVHAPSPARPTRMTYL